MTTIKAKIIGKPEDVAGRSLSLKTGKSEIQTPIYAVDDKSASKLNKSQLDIVEASLLVDVSRYYISKGYYDYESLLEHFASRIYKKTGKPGKLNVAIPVIVGGKNAENVPTRFLKRLISALYEAISLQISEGSLDLTCMPILYGKYAVKQRETIDATALDTVSSTIKPPVVAPVLPWDAGESEINYIAKIADKFNGILDNIVCIDFRGSNPIKKLAGYQILYENLAREEKEGSIIIKYGINIQYSRIKKKTNEDPARDILGFYMGLDVIGPNHRPYWYGSKPPQKIESPPIKLFLRKRYTYANPTYAITRYNQIVKEEYGKILGDKITSILENDEETLKSLVKSNIIKEVQEPIRTLFQNNEYQQYDKPIKYLLSKPIIKEYPEIRDNLSKFINNLTSYL